MRTSSRPGVLMPAVILCIVVAFTAACSSSGGGAGGLAGVDASGSPSPSAAGSGPVVAPTSPLTNSPSPAASHAYPSDYAKAILSAWADQDVAYLTQLTGSSVAHQLLVTIGKPNMHWTALPSDGAAGSTYASFYNDSGSMITLRLNNQALAAKQWHAGSVQTWDKMTYPTDATAYAKKFLDGWIAGNKQRMVLLSSQSITNFFLSMSAPDSSYVLGDAQGAAGSTFIEVTDAANGLDRNLRMSNQTLGKAHAIVGCQPTACG